MKQAFIRRRLADKFDKHWEERHKAPRGRTRREDLGDDGGGDESESGAPESHGDSDDDVEI